MVGPARAIHQSGSIGLSLAGMTALAKAVLSAGVDAHQERRLRRRDRVADNRGVVVPGGPPSHRPLTRD